MFGKKPDVKPSVKVVENKPFIYPDDFITTFARSVVLKLQPVNAGIEQACYKHCSQLINQDTNGLEFKPDEGINAANFFECLINNQLHDWQRFIVGYVFSWYVKETGKRYVLVNSERPKFEQPPEPTHLTNPDLVH